MSTEDYKRGVEDALALPFKFVGTYTARFLEETLSAQRKKLLTKKVTKWTGVILSNYNQQPTMLDIYDSEDDIKHYYTISPALCPPIKLELELPL